MLRCWFKNTIFLHTVPLNYNFTFTRVDTHGATQYFACNMPKFAVEIINTRDEGFIYTGHETRGVQFTQVVVVGSRIKPGEAGTWLAKYTYLTLTRALLHVFS